MSDSRDPPQGSHGWPRTIAVWASLVLLAFVSLLAAYYPINMVTVGVNLAIAAAMVILLWLFLMDGIGAPALLRLIAVAGLLWLSFMFALAFSDYLFRSCETSGTGGSPFCAVQNVEKGAF